MMQKRTNWLVTVIVVAFKIFFGLVCFFPSSSSFKPGHLYTYRYEIYTSIQEASSNSNSTDGKADVDLSMSGLVKIERTKLASKSLLHVAISDFKLKNNKDLSHQQLPNPMINPGIFVVEEDSLWISSLLLKGSSDNFWTNLLKGVASLIRHKEFDDKEQLEADSSGSCRFKQVSQDDTVTLTKEDCENMEIGSERQSVSDVLKVRKSSSIETKIKFKRSSDDHKIPETAKAEETHDIHPAASDTFGIQIFSRQTLKLTGEEELSPEDTQSQGQEFKTISSFLKANDGTDVTEVLLATSSEYEDSESPEGFQDFVQRFSAYFSEHSTSNHAFTVLQGLRHARSFRDVATFKAVLDNDKHKGIAEELLEFLVACQTKACWSAAFDYAKRNLANLKAEALHRILLAVSHSSTITQAMLEDFIQFFNVLKKQGQSQQVVFSAYHTLTSLFQLFAVHREKGTGLYMDIKLSTTDLLIQGFRDCAAEDDECHMTLLSAMGNYPRREFVDLAKEVLLYSPDKATTAVKTFALKLFEGFPLSDADVDFLCRLANEDYGSFPLAVRYGALGILSATGSCKLAFSVLNQTHLVRGLRELTTYNTGSQETSSNWHQGQLEEGSLNYRLAILGGANGALKRSCFSVFQDADHSFLEVGLFADAVDSLIDSKAEEADQQETPTAGLQLKVLGKAVRPLRFFSGSTELMSSVWAAPETPTSVLRSLLMLQDFKTKLFLQSGLIVEHTFTGAVSLDILGSISISLWNRNAKSTVTTSAGLALLSQSQIKSSRMSMSHTAQLQTNLEVNFLTYVNFYVTPIEQCLVMKYPKTTIKKSLHVTELPAGVNKVLNTEEAVHGKSFPFGSKNSEMCAKLVPVFDDE